jgi:hypothetical protein
MARHQGAGLTGYGVSNTLKSQGLERSERIATRGGKNGKDTSGFKVKLLDTQAERMDRVVRVEHFLGTNHGITDAAEREQIVSNALTTYSTILQRSFLVTREGKGEKEHLLVRERPDPVITETLREVAARLSKAGAAKATVALVNGWAADAEGTGKW